MPIDINLANWNKENENCSPLHTLSPHIQGVTSASAGARFTPKNCRTPFTKMSNYSASPSFAKVQFSKLAPKTLTPKCRKLLKRTDVVLDDKRYTKIPHVFLGDEIIKKDDDQNIVNELLQLCSWWSENENFNKNFDTTNSDSSGENGNNTSASSEDDDDDFFYDNYSSVLRMAPTKCYNQNTSTKYDYFTFEIESEQDLLIKKQHLSTTRIAMTSIASDFDLNASF